MCYLHGPCNPRSSLHRPPPPALPAIQVPACYLHSPPRLQPSYFSKFQPDTLFYIFYGMPGDEAQLYAADELAARCARQLF